MVGRTAPERLNDREAVVALGLALPGVEPGTSYGRPALKLRRATIAGTTAPDPGSFLLHGTAAGERIALLLAPAWWGGQAKAARQALGARP